MCTYCNEYSCRIRPPQQRDVVEGMPFSSRRVIAVATAAVFATIDLSCCHAFLVPTTVVTHHPRRETSFIASAIRDWPASESQRLHVTSMEGSGEGGDRREIVVVGLNGALQRTVVFQPPKGLRVGGVNRASYVGAGIGGKGQNVCVALTMMSEGDRNEENEAGVHITLAHFSGGKSGEKGSVCSRGSGAQCMHMCPPWSHQLVHIVLDLEQSRANFETLYSCRVVQKSCFSYAPPTD